MSHPSWLVHWVWISSGYEDVMSWLFPSLRHLSHTAAFGTSVTVLSWIKYEVQSYYFQKNLNTRTALWVTSKDVINWRGVFFRGHNLNFYQITQSPNNWKPPLLDHNTPHSGWCWVFLLNKTFIVLWRQVVSAGMLLVERFSAIEHWWVKYLLLLQRGHLSVTQQTSLSMKDIYIYAVLFRIDSCSLVYQH